MAKFKDYPCLYYVCANTSRSEQLQFFGALAAMFGLSPSEAADTSELLAHTSEKKLFSGQGFNQDEIMESAGPYFDNPYKDCRSFYRKSTLKKIGLKECCCLVCPYSHFFANARILDERMALKSALLGNRDVFMNDLTADSFCSYLPVSCSNEIGSLPIIKFHSLLFDYLLLGNSFPINEENLFKYIFDALSKQGLFLEPSVLRSFICVQLRQIDNVPDYSSEMVSVALLRLYNIYKYVPEKIVFPSGAPTKAAAKKRNDVLNKDVFSAPLFDMFTEETGAGTSSSSSNADNEVSTEEMSMAETEKNDTAPSSFQKGDEETLASAQTNNEPFYDLDNLTFLTDTESMNATLSETSTCSTVTESPECPSTDIEEDFDSDLAMDIACAENPPRKRKKKKKKRKHKNIPDNICLLDKKTQKSLRAVLFDYSLKNYFRSAFARPDTSLLCRPDKCAICNYSRLHETSLRELSFTQMALFFYARSWYNFIDELPTDVNEIQCIPSFATLPPRGSEFYCLRTASGCSFASGDDVRNDCVYNFDTPVISEKFFPYILNCTGNTLNNLIDFISEACNCRHISVESVVYDNITGLLFYVNGHFYFFNPYYDTVGFLKPLFADATKATFYSVNPIPVYSCLHSIGIWQIKLESVAAFYSGALGIKVLLPSGLIFDLSRGTLPDIYSRIMPQYREIFERSLKVSTHKSRKIYEKGVRLERALGYSKNLSKIAKGNENCIQGGNYFRYRFLFSDLNLLTERGTLINVKIKNSSSISNLIAKNLWEDVAGRVASASNKFLEYAFLLTLSVNGITYFCCYESSHFYDLLIDVVRSAYRDVIGGVPDVIVECERYS